MLPAPSLQVDQQTSAGQQPTLKQHVDASPNTPINVTITYNMHRQQLPELPTSPNKHLYVGSEFNSPPKTNFLVGSPHPPLSVGSPHPPLSLGQSDGITNMLNQRSQTGSRGHMGRHSHRLRPLLNKTTVIQGRSLSIARQARLNSSRARKSTLQPVKAEGTGQSEHSIVSP